MSKCTLSAAPPPHTTVRDGRQWACRWSLVLICAVPQKMIKQGIQLRKWLQGKQRFPDALTRLHVSWVLALIFLLRCRFPPCCHRTFCKLPFVVFPVVVIPIPLGISSPPTVIPGSRRTAAWCWSVVGKTSAPSFGQPNLPRIESVSSMSFLFRDIF